MCGIVGSLSFSDSNFDVTEAYLTRMRDIMGHRGPDGMGTWVSSDRRIGMGHRRLAIIDLSAEALQPMHSVSGDLTIVYNGEIYNHAKLREELKTLGRNHWQTDHSDTEVVLEAFQQWGIDCIQRFRGMFAFAIWDQRTRDLWLVRDRIGIKPLYHSMHHGRLTFASEIKALLLDPEQSKTVDEEALFHYLTFLVAPAPYTMFAGIKKLPAGCWLKVNEGGSTELRRYWDVWEHTAPLKQASEADVAELLLAEFRDSVQLRKASDVPIGIFLSGGIDSSANTIFFSQGETKPVQTFSIGYSGEHKSYPNETQYARQIASLVGADHHELFLTPDDLLSFLPQMVFYQDEPLADPVCVPLYFVSKLARDHGVVVCQVGEGSDELFWGYPAWKRQLNVQQWTDALFPLMSRHLACKLLSLWPSKRGSRYEYIRRATNSQPIFWSGAGAFTEAEKDMLLSSTLRQRLRDSSSYEVVAKVWTRFQESAWEPSYLNWMTYMDLNLRLPELLLMRVDKMSMATSLEARVPFLDHRFVALVLSIPTDLKFRDGINKYILKKAFNDIVPENIINRPKQGFAVPITDWLLEGLGETCRLVVRRFCIESNLLDPKEVEQVFARGDSARIWCLWNLASWWLQHFS